MQHTHATFTEKEALHSGCVNFEAEHEQDRVTAQTLVIMCQCKSYTERQVV